VARLLPDRGETTVAEELSDLGLVELAHDDRPYVVMNFAATVDGEPRSRAGPARSAARSTPRSCSASAPRSTR
jgi:hypothetical protein